MFSLPVTLLGLYAIQYLNTPYEWAGNGPFTMDCSGFIVKVLNDVGYEIPDHSAQMLFDHFKNKENVCSSLNQDSILFFGISTNRITHVALAISDEYMIEAGGGDRTTIDIETAAKQDARVKISKISRRGDLVASFSLKNIY